MKCETILDALNRAGPLSTPDLATALGVDAKAVYNCCRRSAKRGELQSTLAQGRRLLFCIADKTVITSANYEHCKEQHHPLAGFYAKVRIWSVRDVRARGRRKRRPARRRRAA